MSFLTPEQLTEYKEKGFLVVRGLLSDQEVQSTRDEMKKIIDGWYDEYEATGKEGPVWQELVNIDPAVKRGDVIPESRYQSVRKLYRMAGRNKEFFVAQAKHKKILSMCEQILGKDVKLLQSMALLKPPGTAEKRWHQDNAYFRLTPVDVMAFWIAIDPAFVENGCMHVVHSSHKSGIDQHAVPEWAKSTELGNATYGLTEIPDPEKVTAIPLNPGDALVFHGALKHFTPANKSTFSRYAVQYHYAASHCQPTVCPDDERSIKATKGSNPVPGDEQRPVAFDCDPCVEPQFWFYRKAEMTVLGEERGGFYI